MNGWMAQGHNQWVSVRRQSQTCCSVVCLNALIVRWYFLLYTWHIRRKRSMSSDYVLQAWQVSLQTKGGLYIVIQFSAVAGTIQVEWNSGKTSLTIRVQLLSDCVQLRTLQRRLATISFTVCTLRITKHNSGSSFLNVNELKFNDFIWLTLVFVLLQ